MTKRNTVSKTDTSFSEMEEKMLKAYASRPVVTETTVVPKKKYMREAYQGVLTHLGNANKISSKLETLIRRARDGVRNEPARKQMADRISKLLTDLHTSHQCAEMAAVHALDLHHARLADKGSKPLAENVCKHNGFLLREGFEEGWNCAPNVDEDGIRHTVVIKPENTYGKGWYEPYLFVMDHISDTVESNELQSIRLQVGDRVYLYDKVSVTVGMELFQRSEEEETVEIELVVVDALKPSRASAAAMDELRKYVGKSSAKAPKQSKKPSGEKIPMTQAKAAFPFPADSTSQDTGNDDYMQTC